MPRLIRLALCALGLATLALWPLLLFYGWSR
jgi:hypothetical protein